MQFSMAVVVQLTIVLAFFSSIAGLALGLGLCRRDTSEESKQTLAWLGNIIAGIAIVVLVFDDSLSASAYETLGLLLSLSLMLGFMGIGLCLGQSPRGS
jgi:hypothetical protein